MAASQRVPGRTCAAAALEVMPRRTARCKVGRNPSPPPFKLAHLQQHGGASASEGMDRVSRVGLVQMVLHTETRLRSGPLTCPRTAQRSRC